MNQIATWKPLYRAGAIAALTAAILFRRNIGAEVPLFTGIETIPAHAADWFNLLQSNPFVGLSFLAVFDLVNYFLVGSFALEQPTGGSWMFLLASPDPLTTRLIVRTRVASYRPEWLSIILYRLILEPVHFIMERGMLMGLKRRVEKTRR